MKIQRASKLYFKKWITRKKLESIDQVLEEYSRVVNYFIVTYEGEIPNQGKLSFLYANCIQKGIRDTGTWFTARMVKNAFAEGYSMVQGAKERSIKSGKYYRPVHYGKKATLSETINTQSYAKDTKSFDFNVCLGSLGNKLKISIPLRRHKQFNHWNEQGKRAKSIILTRNYIQFSFEVETGSKKESGDLLGIDLGVNNLITGSDANMYGSKYHDLLLKLKRKKQHSKAWYRAKEEVKEYIDSAIKSLPLESTKLLVVEKLKHLKFKMKERRRLSKNNRFFVSSWTYRYILGRLEQQAENNRVTFRSVPAYNTSRSCNSCGYTDKRNRITQDVFLCQSCNHTDHADINAAKNILDRFLTGPYGAGYKPKTDSTQFLSV